ncbi:amidohydrolase family protein [Aurantiacibacter sp. D1-12]|uniref:amidohydrolase family protein n=1 Tax=Aurantiacibacter sp. D1-12 TaxID=2993658 RepID=UPI00237C8D7D|nr:amidohydrolase family protein [Aurantiacibacter sp. D1-12]MDE1467472.1 amidohydrolase family protein [Aurantiacibacter sp. D1-12]
MTTFIRMIAVQCLFILFLASSSIHPASAQDASSAQASVLYAIEHVTVLPMTEDGVVLHDATVVIEGDRIISLEGPAPDGAQRIDGSGRFLIPGLVDMHVHVPGGVYLTPQEYPTQPPTVHFNTQDIMTPYIANGVTTIFNLGANPAHFGQRDAVENGDVIGPHMALAALIDGGGQSGRIANTPSDGRQAVRDAIAEGYEFIKLYSRLDAETYAAIIDEAHQHGLRTVGHIPNAFQGRLEGAFETPLDMVAHAEELTKHTENFSDDDAERFCQLLADSGTWLTPTMMVMERISSQSRSLDSIRESHAFQYVHPLFQSKWLTANQYNENSTPERTAYFENMVDFHRRLVRVCRTAGVPMLAGTDTLTSGVVAGFSLHDELELMVDAGLTNEEALASATRLPSIWLGVDSDRGTVDVGKRADLVLLEADPTQDIRNARLISGVFINGRWVDRSTLDSMLADLSQRNTESRDQYDWNRIRGR